jgi:DNA invertase Pin-like site-specific DNA recombinase
MGEQNVRKRKQAILQADVIINPNAGSAIGGEKITSRHLERLSMVYIRQSTPQQMIRHQESTQVQYHLKNRALAMGWPEDCIEVIDEDLGQTATSSEARQGFQRLMTEVSLDHVGIIFGVEMSRLARSCRDWHQLLEICALFGTLIADLDGIYDPTQYNDRLLLGLKGTLSEAELHMLKQRMYQGKMNKARRGELLFPLPIGYVRRPNGEVAFDPDEQVRAVVNLVFEKFEELKTLNALLHYLVKHNIQMGVRIKTGLRKGELEWRRCNRMTLQNILKNPTYAGAYVYGRRKVDPRRKLPGRPSTGRTVVAPEDCEVFIKDRFPAYISWEQFERNRKQLRQNRSVSDSFGSVRNGPALLAGLLICKRCGYRMAVQYSNKSGKHYRYSCNRMLIDYGGERCQSLAGPPLDHFISEKILEALKPSSLKLSLKAAEDFEKERQRLDNLWQKRLERARYASERAARQYSFVEPENRLVARQLEKEWEEKLKEQKKVEREYERFRNQRPRLLCEQERKQVMQLAVDIPALWNDPHITAVDRKEILRQVVDRVMIGVVGDTERVKVDIQWAGGMISKLETIRPVAKLEQLSYYPDMTERIRRLAEQGKKARQIVDQLNLEEWRPPKRRKKFGRQGVMNLMNSLGLTKRYSRSKDLSKLSQDEWWLPTLAEELGMPKVTLYQWIRRGWVKAHKQKEGGNRWIIWANPQEIGRLRQLRNKPLGYRTRSHWIENDD